MTTSLPRPPRRFYQSLWERSLWPCPHYYFISACVFVGLSRESAGRQVLPCLLGRLLATTNGPQPLPWIQGELRDWSLITGSGGYKTGEGGGGHVKFYPYEKRGGGAEKVLAMLKGGGTQKLSG